MLTLILTGLLRGVRSQRSLVCENLALRHQLAVLRRTAPRPRLRRSDRLFWVLLSRLWSGWTDGISIVQPATAIRWQRSGFKVFWTWKSRRPGPGRPAVALEVRALIRRMSTANPLWGAPRIHGELQKLGIESSNRGEGAVDDEADLRLRFDVLTKTKTPERHPSLGAPWRPSARARAARETGKHIVGPGAQARRRAGRPPARPRSPLLGPSGAGQAWVDVLR
jgi:hypothetical protein